jgi:predicted aspartyl protease
MEPMDWSRRDAALALAALLPAAGCAAPRRLTTRPLVSINLADGGPLPRPEDLGDGRAQLDTASDASLRMTVPVHLDGQGPFEFVVDTGANRSVVADRLALALGLPSAGTAPVHSIAGLETAALVRVRELRVDKVTSGALRLPVMPRDRLGADGLLGVDMLRNRRVALNFKQRRFEISPSSRRSPFSPATDSRIAQEDPPVLVPARYRAGQLVILDAEAADQPVAAFLDSGSQITVGNIALRDAVLRARPKLRERLVQVPLISATGQTIQGELANLGRLRLGGLAVTNVLVAFAPLHVFEIWDMNSRPSILVGVDVMREFDDILLDFGRREVLFWPPSRRR